MHRAERGGSCGGGAREVESQVHARLRSDLRLGRGGPEVQLLAPAERVAHEGRGGVEPEWQPGHVHAVSAAGRERTRRERSAAALLAAPRRAGRGSAGMQRRAGTHPSGVEMSMSSMEGWSSESLCTSPVNLSASASLAAVSRARAGSSLACGAE